MPPKHIVIIGAGVAGLSAAYDLSQSGTRVTICEAAPQVGGLAAGFKAPHWDWTLEKYYHHWFQSDKHILGLISELGWSQQVRFPRPYTVVYQNGRFQPLDSISQAIQFTLRNFPILDTLRFGAVGAYLRLSPWWRPLEGVTADAWMRKWVGERVYNALWRPLLVGKFGEENLDVVNMAWLWARLKSRTTRLGTFEGGFQAFLDQLAQHLRQQSVDIRLNTPVTAIHRSSDIAAPWLIHTADGVFPCDAVISTTSPAAMAALSPELPASYSQQLQNLQSMGAVVLVLSLKQRLTSYYWHNLPKEAGFPFLALVEHTNYIGPEHYGGEHIVYCGDYLPPDHEYFELSKEQIIQRFLPALQRFNPDFDASWLNDSWLWTTRYAQPVPHLNHSHNIPPVRTPLPGLYFASMSQIYPWDRGTNYAVEMGRQVASFVIDDLSASSPSDQA